MHSNVVTTHGDGIVVNHHTSDHFVVCNKNIKMTSDITFAQLPNNWLTLLLSVEVWQAEGLERESEIRSQTIKPGPGFKLWSPGHCGATWDIWQWDMRKYFKNIVWNTFPDHLNWKTLNYALLLNYSKLENPVLMLLLNMTTFVIIFVLCCWIE